MKSLFLLTALLFVATGSAMADESRRQNVRQQLTDNERVSASSFIDFQALIGGELVELDGVATLTRTRKGISYTANTRDLEPGGAYTNWFVAFNKPRQCLDPCACGLDDLTNPFAEVGVYYATGRIADAYGQATFTSETDYRELPDGADQVPFPTLNFPVRPRAEVHVVVRRHGEISDDPAVRQAQLEEFNGGCDDQGCFDTQVSVHRSPFCRAPKRRGGPREQLRR